MFFFYNAPATTEIYTLSLHDALPILRLRHRHRRAADCELQPVEEPQGRRLHDPVGPVRKQYAAVQAHVVDRKSTRLNSSHPSISYAVFCLKKKKTIQVISPLVRGRLT